MAERDETSARRKRINTGGTNQQMDSGQQANGSLGWFLEREFRYPVRHGNLLTPYYSGQEAFTAVADSIQGAKKSVDMIMWGFDPAMPVRRSAAYNMDHTVYEANLIFSDKTYQYSVWRENDSIGKIILDALAQNPELKVRLVIWYHPFSLRLMKNVVGVGGALVESDCPRDEVNTGFNPSRLKDPNLWGADPGMTRLALRGRHPDAVQYSAAWFKKVRWEQFPGRDRLAVTFRDFKGMESLNRVLESRFALFGVDAVNKMVELHKEISNMLPTLNRDKTLPLIGRSPAEISRAIDEAMEGARDWAGITDKLVSLKQQYIRLVEAYNNNVLDTYNENAGQMGAEVISKLGIQEEDMNLDLSLFYSYKERITLCSPTDHQKTVLIDYEDDSNRHGYIMGHNTLTKYWSRFPFVHRDKMNEMDYTPLHDFSMRVDGPLVIDINHNFCQAWEVNRVKGISDFTEREIRRSGTQSITPSALEKESPAQLRQQRESLTAHILSQPPKGNARGQVVRTRSDQKFPGTQEQEKEVKDAYLQAVRHANNYIFIVNQYCQYPKLVRHIKYWRRQRRNAGLTGTLYILIGTCKPEQDGQVFAAQQMANELGVGVQFTKAHDELYDKNDADQQGRRSPTFSGYNAGATSHVMPQDLSALDIKVLFFMFHTQIPATPRTEKGKPLREDVTAQQPYVHAKLMLLDDVFLTLGSSNLNTRSMAVDSEINLISDDYSTAQSMRHKLFGDYSGQRTSPAFPNNIYGTDRGVDTQAMQNDMKKVFSRMLSLADLNSEKVKDGKRITGCISSFEDDRSGLTARVG